MSWKIRNSHRTWSGRNEGRSEKSRAERRKRRKQRGGRCGVTGTAASATSKLRFSQAAAAAAVVWSVEVRQLSSAVTEQIDTVVGFCENLQHAGFRPKGRSLERLDSSRG
ncbi:hypothetical protein AXG93_1881s1300 [Marchantia polymorpha subsp. ruderalis]|uniref:Uncharacterized protein n=1 Tax=Marchantia polymorpha subsp. ruderalis TaxID=1480154 RepID=A0A176W478_MARPO|nr:hypothetical protein AXG93_1881s1300 [Marchantia polymorpha subsp. ruderalis]